MPELVVALDLPNSREALSLAETLKGRVKWLKVGLQLFIAAGPDLLRALREIGFEIFLDLKFYDIPNTVANAVKSACALDVAMLTIHAQGGRRMCQAAYAAAMESERPPIVACVTALTSFGAGEMPGINLPPAEFAIEMAGQVAAWGLKALVCSPLEVARIKEAWPGLACVCPGIRLAGADSNDQKRTLGPGEAAANGADFLVVGRPVTQAPSPQEAVEELLRQMRQSLGGA